MRRRLAWVGLVVLLAIPLALLLYGFARDVLAIGLLRLVWAVRVLFESLPQMLLWLGLLFVGLVLALVSLLWGKPLRWKPSPQEPEPWGQVYSLARRIQRAPQGKYYHWELAQYIAWLAWEVMAYRQGTTPQQLRQRFKAGGAAARPDLPPTVLDCLQAADRPSFALPASLLARARRFWWGDTPSPSPELALEQIIEFLEEQLNV